MPASLLSHSSPGCSLLSICRISQSFILSGRLLGMELQPEACWVLVAEGGGVGLSSEERFLEEGFGTVTSRAGITGMGYSPMTWGAGVTPSAYDRCVLVVVTRIPQGCIIASISVEPEYVPLQQGSALSDMHTAAVFIRVIQ